MLVSTGERKILSLIFANDFYKIGLGEIKMAVVGT